MFLDQNLTKVGTEIYGVRSVMCSTPQDGTQQLELYRVHMKYIVLLQIKHIALKFDSHTYYGKSLVGEFIFRSKICPSPTIITTLKRSLYVCLCITLRSYISTLYGQMYPKPRCNHTAGTCAKTDMIFVYKPQGSVIKIGGGNGGGNYITILMTFQLIQTNLIH